jgi:hypothetical protein
MDTEERQEYGLSIESLPKIIFCTTCRGRAQHVEQTLMRNMADNADYPNCKFLVLDYNSLDNLSDYLKIELKESGRRLWNRWTYPESRLVAYNFPDARRFNMAHAKNMAHRCGMLEGADVLCNLDADNYTGLGFARYIADNFRENDGSFLRSVWPFGKDTSGEIKFNVIRGCSGRIAISRNAFLKVGGYDERYDTWGPDDKDFIARMERLRYAAKEISGNFLNSIPHRDKMRFREYPHARNYNLDPAEVPENPIANYGKFGMGTVYRNYSEQPIELGPLPTRIFGIGMHKTATNSLNKALGMLGYDSAHWKSPRWARDIWDEMTTTGRSPTLEQHYALCDLPITILYRELDKTYPGSKFILTMRDEADWLRSVERHFDAAHNMYPEDLHRAATRRLHQELYGRKSFDADVFLERYRRHNAEVREYFKYRPGDFAVMDMSDGAGWSELCGFLNVAPPAEAYPVEFAS